MKTLFYTHNKTGKEYSFQIDQETKNYYIRYEKSYITSKLAKVKVGNTGSKVNGDKIDVYKYLGRKKWEFLHSFRPTEIVGYSGNRIVYLKKDAWKKQWFEDNCSNLEIREHEEEIIECPF